MGGSIKKGLLPYYKSKPSSEHEHSISGELPTQKTNNSDLSPVVQ